MAISVTHPFVSGKADSGDATLVNASNWNAAHTITMATDRLLGRDTASPGVVEEIGVTGNIEFDGSGSIKVADSPSFTNTTLTSTDAGATAAPILTLYRNSASPAASDFIGEIDFNGQSSTGVLRTYAWTAAKINDPTNASEDAELHIGGLVAGINTSWGWWAPSALNIYSSDAGAAAGPSFTLYRDSATPAASDAIGQLFWAGEDSASNYTNYIKAAATILDPTNASEDAKLEISTLVAGAEVVALGIANGVVAGAPTGSYKGTGTINAVTLYQADVPVMTTTDTQTATNKTFTADKQTVYAFSAAASFSITASNGNIQRCPTNGNATVTLPADVTGQMFIIDVEYGGTHTVTWATTGGDTLEWAGGVAPTATSVSGKVDRYLLLCTEANIWRGADGGRNF